MTTTAEKIKVMQAFVGGKTVECRASSNEGPDCWSHLPPDGGEPRWNWQFLDYRIKPEPREWWLVIGELGDVRATYKCKRAAENHVARIRPDTAEVVLAREVIES